MRSKTFLLVSVLALALSACSGSAAATPADRNLMVSGNGIVYLTPDIAYIYVGVHTEDPDIAQAVVDALKNMGVAATDIQTSSFSVWPSQQNDPMTNLPSGFTYTVDNTVYITVRDLTKLGRLLDTVVGAGANNINSIQFDVADKTAALAEARQKAMDNAGQLRISPIRIICRRITTGWAAVAAAAQLRMRRCRSSRARYKFPCRSA